MVKMLWEEDKEDDSLVRKKKIFFVFHEFINDSHIVLEKSSNPILWDWNNNQQKKTGKGYLFADHQ